MTATPHNIHVVSLAPSTGHRPGRRPEEPRNSTVCFTVTEQEKAIIDAISMCTNLRRSAILTEIVTRFIAAAQSPVIANPKKLALFEFLEECNVQIQDKRPLFNSFTKEN